MSEYRRGTRVVVTEDIPGVPEGTPGKCGRGLGFAIKRYRVRFDNDVEAISVAHSKLVPEDEWPQFLARRAREEIEAAQERARLAEARAAAAESRGLPAASTEEPAAGESAAPAAETPAELSGDEGDGDPRLAALLARSKSARDATGVAAPESTAAAAPETPETTTEEPAPATAAAPAAEQEAPAPAAAPAAQPEAAEPAKPARSAPPSGPERVEIPEFVPGPEVDPDYTPAANRVSELISEARKDG
ncbi:hypothetical protein [Candidatus Poriferisodalis sp.]|uniref:hypothetical protein n=1 Tax=Candidatus Poriferisodalis sp. TaxID=3101277 RepID=UPI003B025C90